MPDNDSAGSRVRAMSADDVMTVFAWRNHPDIRRSMFSQHEIGIEEHRRWFDTQSQDPRWHLLIYEQAGASMGFVALTQAARGQVADWGFYTAPGAPKGTGRAMGRCALEHAFVRLGLHKVCGQAIEFNRPSIGFHLALGFRQEGFLRDQHFDGERYHGVACFGLLQHEWPTTA
jgi:UDP-4-amino-4,6-dideoxy-N-acetyl-beta-L-altrosamine N-acetyltransferase